MHRMDYVSILVVLLFVTEEGYYIVHLPHEAYS
jgi:hypothetical protein